MCVTGPGTLGNGVQSPPPLFLSSQVGLSEPKLMGLAEFEVRLWSMLVMFSCALCKISWPALGIAKL